jgi:protein-arginine kinase activator protein McsA
MRCSYCGKNEAESVVYMDYMGQKSEMYLCGECMERARQYLGGLYKQFLQNFGRSGEPDVAPPFEPAQFEKAESGAYPIDAGGEIRDRRRLGELRARLADAVEKEDYEQAAALRDEIAKLQRISLEGGVRI